MELHDKIYGRIYLEEPVLQEVVLSQPVQRLQGLMQCGVTYFRFPQLDGTRFEHSVGAMALLQSWDAPVEEQVAGLLHDVNHLAFSHVADIVFGDAQEQEFAEQFHRKIIMGSEIPEILERNGVDPEQIIDFKQFPLLEQSLPDLCADRFDYGLRDTVESGILTLEQAHEILDDVHIIDSSVISFTTQSVARRFADAFQKINAMRYTHPLDMTLYKYFAETLKLALDKQVILMDDFFLTDNEVWEKLEKSGVPEIVQSLKRIPHLEVKVVAQNEPYDYHVKSKIRLIDPWVVSGDDVTRLSELDPDFAIQSGEFKNTYEEGFFVQLV